MPNVRGKTRKRASQPRKRQVISLVIPAFNEEPNLLHLYRRIVAVWDALEQDCEIIFVDDGSSDGTERLLMNLHHEDGRVKVIALSRNFGQSAALTAGIEAARGDALVILDADGQDPPEAIPAMIAKWREGFEIVGGHRVRRSGQPLHKRIPAYLFYRVMNALVGWELPPDTGEFRLIDRKVAEVFKACPQRHRLVRTLTSWAGFRQTTIDYEHGARHAGRSKYSFFSSLRLAITSITAFSLMPLRAAVAAGCVIVAVSLAASAVVAIRGLQGQTMPWLTLSIAGLWLLGGVQCVFLGLLGEYVGRTYMETQHRPIYVVRDRIGFDD